MPIIIVSDPMNHRRIIKLIPKVYLIVITLLVCNLIYADEYFSPEYGSNFSLFVHQTDDNCNIIGELKFLHVWRNEQGVSDIISEFSVQNNANSPIQWSMNLSTKADILDVYFANIQSNQYSDSSYAVAPDDWNKTVMPMEKRYVGIHLFDPFKTDLFEYAFTLTIYDTEGVELCVLRDIARFYRLQPNTVLEFEGLTFDTIDIGMKEAIEVYVQHFNPRDFVIIGEKEPPLEYADEWSPVTIYRKIGSLTMQSKRVDEMYKISVPLPSGIDTESLQIVHYALPEYTTHISEPYWFSNYVRGYDQETNSGIVKLGFFTSLGFTFSIFAKVE